MMIAAGMVRSGWQAGGGRGQNRVLIGLVVGMAAVAIGIAILTYNIGFGLGDLARDGAVRAGGACLARLPLAAGAEPDGRGLMDQIDGFRQYLSVAEEDRLEFLNPPKKTPKLFERFLPYAIALDVENSWANRFTGVLAAAGVGAAVSSWYVGRQFQRPTASARSPSGPSDNLSSTIVSASTPPGVERRQRRRRLRRRLSGGGSSGGGGGGGGGSGW